jgi:O-antigen/teichoic acid export membrane protein
LLRRDSSSQLSGAFKEAPFPRRFKGAKIVDQAWPMTVIMIALPVGIQTDRIILSHVTTSAELAQYNLASQMYTPIFALVSAAGFTLWPRFAASRAKNKRSRRCNFHSCLERSRRSSVCVFQ